LYGNFERAVWSTGAFDEDESAPDHGAYQEAYTRSIALEAEILGRLTTPPARESLHEEAASMAALAAERLKEPVTS